MKIDKPALEWNTKSSHIIRSLNVITRIIIHHSATSSGDVQSFHRYHIDNNGWYGVGYHYVILKDGTVQQGRPLDVQGAHAGGNNADSIGICLVGNFETEQPTAAQYQALADLISFVESLLGRSLSIQLHSDVNNTACPGKNFDYTNVDECWKSPSASDQETVKLYCKCCGAIITVKGVGIV